MDGDENLSSGAAKSALPSVALPKGGGAIRDIGEKFSVAGATGTGSFRIPMPLSPGRSSFGPSLELSYDSSSGNGVFGFGWQGFLTLPNITRKTDKGLPQYDDSAESDVFIYSGAEDLVPVLDTTGVLKRTPRMLHGIGYSITWYRPRIEGLFARIERWQETTTAKSHWRCITHDNITTLFGLDSTSCIADPSNPARIFSYLPCRTFDQNGNVIVYDYVAEDATGVDVTTTHEANREPSARTVQRYLKSIRYGNSVPYFPDWSESGADSPLPAAWHFHAVIDYGDHSLVLPQGAPDIPWPVRKDPYSHYRAGFEVRTYRRCTRVLMFHDFPAEQETAGSDCLVKSIDFVYTDEIASGNPNNPIYTFLAKVTQTGYIRNGAFYRQASMPPLEFSYSEIPTLQASVQTPDEDLVENVPEGIAGSNYRFVDLDGEGLSGILSEAGNTWFYKRNVGAGNLVTQSDGTELAQARFLPIEVIASLPSRTGLDATQRLMDLSADGRLDLVAFAEPAAGYFERTETSSWLSLVRFESLPLLDWAEPNLRFVDLTGDGLADVLLTEEGVFTLWQSRGGLGFTAPERVATTWDEQRGPKVVLADGSETIFLADMCGDGLSDLVRVRNGEVCYWPNLGYGRFGAKVTMDGSPRFTSEDQFDPRRVRLADIDGSGTVDLLYVGSDGILVCLNCCGNSWAAMQRLVVFPSSDLGSRVDVVDLLGTGTACLVWNSALPFVTRSSLRYVDLMGGQKPHLLTSVRNNLGAETRITYAPSTRFYVQDKLAGDPWITRVHFPVHVVERVEIFDWVSRSRFVSRYAYHHGYFDGVEREFRGFGRVDQWDTDEHRSDNAFGDALNWDAESWSPPTLTKTWYHTGAFLDADIISKQFAGEYWVEPDLRPVTLSAHRAAMELADSTLFGTVGADELREAYRALKGQILRSEVYAEDNSNLTQNPYSVTEHNYLVTLLQHVGPNRHAAFYTHARETLAFQYERAPKDPRVAHDVVLEVDPFGNELRHASIVYPRRQNYPAPEPYLSAQFQSMLAYDQARLHVVATGNVHTDSLPLTLPEKTPDGHRTPLLSETVTAEFLLATPTIQYDDVTNLFTFDDLDTFWKTLWSGIHDVHFEDVAASDLDGAGALPIPARRIVGHTRSLYRSDDLTALLAFRELQLAARTGQTYALRLTAGQIDGIFAPAVSAPTLTEGGYVQQAGDDGWWAPSERVYYSPGDTDTAADEYLQAKLHFFLPRRTIDAFGAISRIDYDTYDLLGVATTDAVGNVTTALNHYRVLQPYQITDANQNSSRVALDALGIVVLMAVMGKTGENLGDRLDVSDDTIGQDAVRAYVADPLGDATANPLGNAPLLLGEATERFVYDAFAYYNSRTSASPLPLVVATLKRQTHVSDLAAGQVTTFQHALAYIDGFGRTIQTKTQSAPGPLVDAGPSVSPRWIGSGWTIYNNKGKPVRKYEPFFSPIQQFEFAAKSGVSSTLFYDPAERVIATLHPDSTWEKVVFDAWQQANWDGNDTALISDPRTDGNVGDYFVRFLSFEPNAFTSWHDQRLGGMIGTTADELAAQKDAARKVEPHKETPAIVHFDALGRGCLSVADNGGNKRFATRTAMNSAGKPLAVFDALGRRVFEYCRRVLNGSGGFHYVAGVDVAGTQIYQNGMDGGARSIMPDTTGRPIRRWDAREHEFSFTYDPLRRPTHHYVSTNGAPKILLERIAYGEKRPATNLCGRMARHFDGSGVLISSQYDYKGNLVASTRQFATDYRKTVDWLTLDNLTELSAIDSAAQLKLSQVDRFDSAIKFDALNRELQITAPHSATMRPNVIRRTYNEASQLLYVDVWTQQATAPAIGALLDPATATFRAVSGIEYNARNQRTALNLQNGSTTTYTYDPNTFRLANLQTTRPNTFAAAERVVQMLSYYYDPCGNITRIRDDADTQPVIYFRNTRVDPTNDYTYDPTYRLIAATGREYAKTAVPQTSNDDGPRARATDGSRLLNPQDGTAMAVYAEAYDYDAVGNILTMTHDGAWTRNYTYTEPSQIVATETNNRLSTTSLPGDPVAGPFAAKYACDAHGNMVTMPHLSSMVWDELDRMRSTARQAVGSATPQTTYYLYDAGGERHQKATDAFVAQGQQPRCSNQRLYLGAVEVYREFGADGTTVALQRETLHVMDDKQRVALVETLTDGSDSRGAPAQQVRYQYGNHLGSAVLELDDRSQVISYEEYYSYGSTSYQAASNQTDLSKRYRYTGKERDEENDLYYHGARYYAAWLGRWSAADPAGMVDGSNLFAYTREAPTGRLDPTGTETRASDAESRCPSHHKVPTQTRKIDFDKAEETYQAAIAAPLALPDPDAPTRYREKASKGLVAFFLPPGAVDFYRKDKLQDDYLSTAYFFRHGGRQGDRALQASINHMAWQVNDLGGHAQYWTKEFTNVATTFLSVVDLGMTSAAQTVALGQAQRYSLMQSLREGTILHPSYFRFSQKSVNGVVDIAASMRASSWIGPRLEAVRVGSKLVALDNTRLLAAYRSGTLVRAAIHEAWEPLPAYNLGRFVLREDGIAATTWGEAALTRIANQGKPYARSNPLGSLATGSIE